MSDITIVKKITLEEVRAAKPEMIYYGAATCWWTHDPAHLDILPDGIPCDPRGGILFETDKVEDFLKQAEANSEYYGKHGMDAFIAAHHLNCIVRDGPNKGRPSCDVSWDAYNEAIDRGE